MCGRLNVIDDPFVRELMSILGIPAYPDVRLNLAPGSLAQVVVQQGEQRFLQDAYWSLLIEPKPGGSGYRPCPRWKTFNARSRRLEESGLWSAAYKKHRAIIPASGFHEWKDGQCYNIRVEDAPMALAGLYREWDFEGEVIFSFTVITLPPQKQFEHIHSKSFPLMLLEDEVDRWLDPEVTGTDALDHLLETGIRRDLIVEPVAGPMDLKTIGEGEIIRP